MSTVWLVLAGAMLIALLLIVVLTRRTHLHSWRIGVFYESEERFTDDDDREAPEG